MKGPTTLSFRTASTTVTLQSGRSEGKRVVKLYVEGTPRKFLASFNIEYLWDFMMEVLRRAGKDEEQYLDKGRRYKQMLATELLGAVLTSSKAEEVLQQIAQIGILP